MNAAPDGRFVYGLNVYGLDDVRELWPSDRTDHGWPIVRVDQCDEAPPALHELDGERSVRRLLDGRHLELRRRSGTATFYGPTLGPDLLAHPYLAPVAVTFNRWSGREAFHAAAFVAGDRAFIVVGGSTAGKSTLMAAMAAAGTEVLADDIVITDGRDVFAGPRSVDLREPIPLLPLTTSRSRLATRHRVGLAATRLTVPLGGWIFLNWQEDTTMRPVGASTLLQRAAAWRALPSLPSDPSCLLDLASVPAWDFGRPKDWDALSAGVQLVARTTSSAVGTPAW